MMHLLRNALIVLLIVGCSPICDAHSFTGAGGRKGARAAGGGRRRRRRAVRGRAGVVGLGVGGRGPPSCSLSSWLVVSGGVHRVLPR